MSEQNQHNNTELDNQASYHLPTLYAFLLHFAVIVVVLIGLTTNFSKPTNNAAATDKVKIVKAVAVNQTAVDTEIQRLKRQQAQKRARELAYQRHLQAQAQRAKAERRKEQRHLAQLQRQQQQIAKQQAAKVAKWRAQQRRQQQQTQAEIKHLAKLKQQQRQETDRVARLKRQQRAMQQQRAKEQQKLAAIKKQQAALAAKKKRAAKLNLEKQLQQQMAAEQKKLADSEQQYVNNIVATYKSLILNAIQQKWLVPYGTKNDLSCQLLIKLANNGRVESVTVTKSSGDPALDNSARAAVFKASPLPMPKNPRIATMFHTISLTVRPEQIRRAAS